MGVFLVSIGRDGSVFIKFFYSHFHRPTPPKRGRGFKAFILYLQQKITFSNALRCDSIHVKRQWRSSGGGDGSSWAQRKYKHSLCSGMNHSMVQPQNPHHCHMLHCCHTVQKKSCSHIFFMFYCCGFKYHVAPRCYGLTALPCWTFNLSRATPACASVHCWTTSASQNTRWKWVVLLNVP